MTSKSLRTPIHHASGASIALFVLVLAGAFALLIAPAMALPSNRAYEMVSLPDKQDGEVGAGGFESGFRASISGDRLAYTGLGGFGGAGSNTITGGYVAERGSEAWTTRTLQLPTRPGLSGEFGPVDLSRDLSRAVVQTNADPATGDLLPMFTDFLYDPFSAAATTMTPLTTTDGTYTAPILGQIAGSVDFDPVYFETPNAPLTTDAEGLSGKTVYRLADGELTLASILPNGDPTSANLAAGHNSGSAALLWTAGSRTVSDNGDVLFFVSNGDASNKDPKGPLYRRNFSSQPPVTVLVNGSENDGASIPVGDAIFGGASADGEIAYFLSTQQLVGEDTNNRQDLYRYDVNGPLGEQLELVSTDSEPGDSESQVENVVGVDAQGDTVFFTSKSQLVAGEPTDVGTKLYVWEDGELRFIANNTASTPLRADYASLSNDGNTLAFAARDSSITAGYDGDAMQIYVYEVAQDRLSCASCPPDSGSTNDARINRGSNVMPMTEDPRRYATDGGSVFFDTADALVPADTNGKQDAYIWTYEDGPQLLSGGRGANDSYFVDASRDGSDAFFATRDRLVGWDTDTRLDVYDARVGGGLPEPPEPEQPCSGDDCQGPPTGPPPDSDPGTIDHDGPGNQARERCRKAQRKADRLQRRGAWLKRKAERSKHRANALRRKSERAHGKRAKRLRLKAKRSRRAARQESRRATRVERRARDAARKASRCRVGGAS